MCPRGFRLVDLCKVGLLTQYPDTHALVPRNQDQIVGGDSLLCNLLSFDYSMTPQHAS
jgi:hypothetical protein